MKRLLPRRIAIAACCALTSATAFAGAAAEMIAADSYVEELRLYAVDAWEYEEADRALKVAAAVEPENPRWRIGQAMLDCSRHAFPSAIEHARQATKLDDENAEAYYWLGVAHMASLGTAPDDDRKDHAEDGRDALKKAVKLDPEHADARTLLGIFYIEAPGIIGGSAGRAEKQARRLDEIEGGQFGALAIRALLAAEEEHWGEVMKLCNDAEACAPTEVHILNLRMRQAKAMMRGEADPDFAVSVLENLTRQADDEHHFSRALLGRALLLQGDVERARETLEAATGANPDLAEAHLDLAECYLALGHLEEARDCYAAYLERRPDHPNTKEAKRALKKVNRSIARADSDA